MAVVLLKNSSELRLKDIADNLKMDKSTIYRFLKVLLQNDYIKMNPDNKKYSLGFKFLNIANKVLESIDIRNIAHQHLITERTRQESWMEHLSDLYYWILIQNMILYKNYFNMFRTQYKKYYIE